MRYYFPTIVPPSLLKRGIFWSMTRWRSVLDSSGIHVRKSTGGYDR